MVTIEIDLGTLQAMRRHLNHVWESELKDIQYLAPEYVKACRDRFQETWKPILEAKDES